MTSNITAQHQLNFTALASGQPGFVLFSCFVNGQPAAAIAGIEQEPDGAVHIVPLFVSVTPDMILTDHDGNEAA